MDPEVFNISVPSRGKIVKFYYTKRISHEFTNSPVFISHIFHIPVPSLVFRAKTYGMSGLIFLPKTDQKETVANFNLIRLPRHRLSPNFLFCCKFPTHLKHIHLRLDTCLRRPGCSSQLIHFIEFLGVQFFDKMQWLGSLSYILGSSICLYFLTCPISSSQTNITQSLKKVVFCFRKVSIHPSSHHQFTSFSCHL